MHFVPFRKLLFTKTIPSIREYYNIQLGQFIAKFRFHRHLPSSYLAPLPPIRDYTSPLYHHTYNQQKCTPHPINKTHNLKITRKHEMSLLSNSKYRSFVVGRAILYGYIYSPACLTISQPCRVSHIPLVTTKTPAAPPMLSHPSIVVVVVVDVAMPSRKLHNFSVSFYLSIVCKKKKKKRMHSELFVFGAFRIHTMIFNEHMNCERSMAGISLTY